MARSRTIKVDAGDGTEFDVYLTGDASAGLPLLLCFSTVYGLEDGFRAVADSWADRGYLVAAPDYFHRGGAGVIDRSAPGRARAIARWEGLEVEAAVADAASLVDQASNVASWTGALGAVGYCAGGELAYLAGTRLGAQAVATFHGTHIERHLSEGDRLVRAALHFGAEDELVPEPTVDEIRDGLGPTPESTSTSTRTPAMASASKAIRTTTPMRPAARSGTRRPSWRPSSPTDRGRLRPPVRPGDA